jgi:hypothetical protein
MVTMLLWRLEQGYGGPTMFRHLSIWPSTISSPKKPCLSDHLNLWQGEISQLIHDKKLGPTTLGHPDNYDSFLHFYSSPHPSTWARRSTTFKSQLHILAEQATVQFSVSLQDEHLKTLASAVIKLCLQLEPTSLDVKDLGQLLVQAATRADICPDDSFSKIAMEALEQESHT